MMYLEIEEEKQMEPQKPKMSKIIVFVILIQFIIKHFLIRKSNNGINEIDFMKKYGFNRNSEVWGENETENTYNNVGDVNVIAWM